MSVDLKFHPLADIFPLLEGDDFADLVADIKEHGQREPITTYKGTILDGRNRYRACIEAGVKPFMGEFDGEEKDLVGFVVSANLRRRHLTDDQRAMVAAKLVTSKRGDNQHRAGERTSQAKAAKLLNVSADKVKRVAKVRKDGTPELIASVEKGEVTITAAFLVANLPVEEQQQVVAAGPDTVKEAAKKVREKAVDVAPEPSDAAQWTRLRGRAEKNGLSSLCPHRGGYALTSKDGQQSCFADLDGVEAYLDIIEGKQTMRTTTACGMPLWDNSEAWLAAHPGKTMEDFERTFPPITGTCDISSEPEASAPAEPASEPETESDAKPATMPIAAKTPDGLFAAIMPALDAMSDTRGAQVPQDGFQLPKQPALARHRSRRVPPPSTP
jgi:ParB-like chromosome segregation protein Spo0J